MVRRVSVSLGPTTSEAGTKGDGQMSTDYHIWILRFVIYQYRNLLSISILFVLASVGCAPFAPQAAAPSAPQEIWKIDTGG